MPKLTVLEPITRSGPTWLGFGVLEFVVRLIDHWSRVEMLMRLSPYLHFLTSPLMGLVLTVCGLVLIAARTNIEASRLRGAKASEILDAHGNPYITKWIKLPIAKKSCKGMSCWRNRRRIGSRVVVGIFLVPRLAVRHQRYSCFFRSNVWSPFR